MQQIENKSSKQQSLLCCRACLTTDCRLYDIHEYKVDDAFSRITETDTPLSRDLLPQHLCAWCLTLLRKYASFRDMCVRTQQQLTGTLNWKMETDSIQRPFHLTKTDAIVINCVPSENNIIYEPEGVLMEYNVKAEPEIKYEIQHSNEMYNSFGLRNDINSKTQTGIIVNENIVLKIENENDDKFYTDRNVDPLENRDVKTCEPDEDVLTEYAVDSEIGLDHKEDAIQINDCETEMENLEANKDIFNKKTNQKINSDNDKIYMGSVDNNVNPEKEEIIVMTIEGNKNKVDFEDGDESYGNIESNVCVKQVKSVKGKIENDMVKTKEHDYASFEIANEVKVVVLSKEEQLEEIVLRKKSRNYLEALFKCEECGKGYHLETTYTNHRTKTHNPSMEHPCEICGMRFKWNYLRKTHQEVHRLKFLCDLCNFVSRNRYKAQEHHAMHKGKTFECQYCGKSFINKNTRCTHIRLAHPAHNVVCAECGETFISNQGLQNHIKKTHLEGLKSRQFKCSTCSANFNSVKALNRHTDTAGEHADLRPCEQCGENCASEDALHEHVREKHPIESHHCEECDTTFPCAAAFDTHVRRKHLGERYSNAYPRDIERKIQRRCHTKLHQTDTMLDMMSVCNLCDQCGYKAKNSTVLEYHKRSHLAVKPFACPHCPKTFEMRFKLTWHLRTHTGEKPFKCSECPLAFSTQGNRGRHHKTIHLKQHDSFPCEICARTFTTKGMLKLHVKTIHEGMPWPKRTRKARARARATKPAVDNK